MGKIYRTPDDLEAQEICALYNGFDIPITEQDCGRSCAVHNPSGKPFCCDICHAVPAAYHSEWRYLEARTKLWHAWRGDECQAVRDPKAERERLHAETPGCMRLLACLGPEQCQREFRLLACRQFPFFPYISAEHQFLGLAYEWAFEGACWVIDHLEQVRSAYVRQFIDTHDHLLALFDEEFVNYAERSAEMRDAFAAKRRRIPILHREGGLVLVSPGSGRMRRVK